MKKLKQTLGKQQTKKTKNINLSYTMLPGKKSHYADPAYLYKSPGKSVTQSGLENLIIAIIENYFKNNSVINIDKIVKEIFQKCQESQKFNSIFKDKARLNKTMDNQELKKLEEIKELVEEILSKNQENHKNNQLLEQFYQELGRVIKNKNKITKKEKLQQYDKLIKMLSPRKLMKNEKTMEIPSLGSNPVKIKFTKEEYEIKRQSSHESSLRIGSEGKRVKTAGSSHSALKSENGNQKLKKFLQKEPSLKIIKTKIQYDYSAILEASKSKIQPRSRNITTTNANKNSTTDITTKLNKVKKNEGFVFYRPKTDHKKE